MIKLTRLNGREFVLNCDAIKFMESTPDTVITLSTKEQILVKEKLDEVIRRVLEFKRLVRLWPGESASG